MTVSHTDIAHTDNDNRDTQQATDEQANAVALSDNKAADDAADSRHGAATTARQWQVLSQLQRNRWVGTTHVYEQLILAGFDISLRTVQRDLNALAKRFPIEKITPIHKVGAGKTMRRYKAYRI